MKRLDIVVYIGPAFEAWDPITVGERGNGGSEVAIVELTRRLAAQGHRVRVYGPILLGAGTSIFFDHVEWFHYEAFRNLQCDVLILHRRPSGADDRFNVRRRLTLCWMQDAHVGDELSLERAQRIDRFVVLSTWHQTFFTGHYPFLRLDQVVLSRNGIDPRRFQFDPAPPRDPHRAVYSSSPDRGLDNLLRIWPLVRALVPDAKLDVFYGFDILERRVRGTPEEARVADLRVRLELAKCVGVTSHGRLGQRALANELCSAGVWAYPTAFFETSCIAAMEAQAAGLYVVTTPVGALVETVGERGAWVHAAVNFDQIFAFNVASAMLGQQPGRREALQDFAAKHFAWSGVVDQWLDVIDEGLAQ